jgi:hypothetical protein
MGVEWNWLRIMMNHRQKKKKGKVVPVLNELSNTP